MKLYKFRSVVVSICVAIIYAIINVILMNSLSLLIVDSLQNLMTSAAIIISLFILKHIFLAINQRTLAIGNYYLKMQLNQWFDHYITTKTYEEFKSKDASEYASIYVNDIPRINNLMFDRLETLFYNATLCIVTLFVLFKIHWIMLIMGFVMIGVMSVLPMIFSKRLNSEILKNQRAKESFLNRVTELMQGFGTFLENNSFPWFFKKSSCNSHEFAKSISDVDSFAGYMSAFIDFIGVLTSTISLIILSYLVLENKVSSGTLIATISLMPALGNAASEFISCKVFYSSGKELFNEKFHNVTITYDDKFCKPFTLRGKFIDNDSMQKPLNVETLIRMLQTEGVSVHYKNLDIEFKNLEFKYPYKYLITGQSGSGKSTLLKVLLGEIDSYSGNVFVNGLIKKKNENLFSNVAYVNQNTFLFNDTIYNNVSLGSDIDVNKVKSVLDLLMLTEFDLDHMIYENGKNLSGGQRQRIALARAILSNKSVIIMDEATANLDHNTGVFIEHFVLNLDCMVIMVSHHVSDEIRARFDYTIEI